MAQYRKIHLFGYQSEERKLLRLAKEPVVVDLPWGKAGITTCYDLRFPELYRLMVDEGASFFWCLRPGPWRDWMPGACLTGPEHMKTSPIFFPATVPAPVTGRFLPVTA
jgi:hypothetical protein